MIIKSLQNMKNIFKQDKRNLDILRIQFENKIEMISGRVGKKAEI